MVFTFNFGLYEDQKTHITNTYFIYQIVLFEIVQQLQTALKDEYLM